MKSSFHSASELKEIVEQAVPAYYKYCGNVLREPITYATSDGGKRVRPVLMLMCAEAFGLDIDTVLPYAVALEYIHSYSLVHDDMPEMDNDVIRRGKPSLHAKYGADLGLLTGDMLLSGAFKIASEKATSSAPMHSLANAAVAMAEGQSLELVLSKANNFSKENIFEIYRLKTGALFNCAMCLPWSIAFERGVKIDFSIETLSRIADEVGLIFQIVDDFLDADSGKDIDKPTLINVLGKEHTRQIMLDYDRDIKSFLTEHSLRETPLYEFISSLTTRVQ